MTLHVYGFTSVFENRVHIKHNTMTSDNYYKHRERENDPQIFVFASHFITLCPNCAM